MNDPLGLYPYLVEAVYCTPAEERQGARWVMDPEWLRDIQCLADDQHRPLWQPSFAVSGPDLLMGYPVELREGAGAPHLETA